MYVRVDGVVLEKTLVAVVVLVVLAPTVVLAINGTVVGWNGCLGGKKGKSAGVSSGSAEVCVILVPAHTCMLGRASEGLNATAAVLGTTCRMIIYVHYY